ncbi:hypothetical protein Tco_0271623 [Tanacetum coccineum]
MAPKRRTTRLNPGATPIGTTTTTSVTNAQLQAMIDEGVTAALAARDTTRNGDDSHSSGVGVVGLSDGLRRWSLCSVLAIAQQLVKSNLRLALCKTMLLHGGMPMLRPLLLRQLMPCQDMIKHKPNNSTSSSNR